MTATSVTGHGLGSAETTSRGPKERNFVGGEKILGPRVVAVGSKVLDGSGDATVVLPAFSGVTTDYVVLATDSDVTGATAVTAALVITSTATTLTFKGTATNVIAYSVMKVGMAT